MEVKEENKKIENLEVNEPPIEKPKRNMPILVAAIILVIVILLIVSISNQSKSRMTITTKSTLEKIVEISDLSTVDYTYNAIVTKYIDDEPGKDRHDNAEYYVSYEGIVSAGINFDEIEVEIKDKVISIKLPEAKINEIRVDMGTLEYMKVGKTNESDSISQEAYKLCQKDLEERASKEDEILKYAKDNAKSAIEALLNPWIESLDDGFKVEIV